MSTLRLTLFSSLLSVLVVLHPLGLSAAPAASYGGWQAAWSPDGKQIAYISGLPHSSSNIWIMNADGSGSRQLSKRGAYNPIWTPDGRQIIFQSDRGFGPRYYCRSADGAGDEKTFDLLPPGSGSAVWSPDGKKIVYALSEDSKEKTIVVDQATGNRRELRSELAAREFCWSPDSKKLAIVTGEVVGDSLLLYDLATDKFEHTYHGYCSAPSFSPDGTILAFAAPISKNRHKLVATITNEKKEVKFTVSEFDGKSLSWSRDGSTLLFASATEGQQSRLWTASADGKKFRPMGAAYKWACHPQYSPSGDRVLFEAVSKSSYSSDLYVCKSNGSNVRRLTTTSSSSWQPQWCGASKLAVMTDAGFHARVVLIDMENGQKTPISAFLLQQGCKMSSSPDGNTVALVQGSQIAVVSLTPKLSIPRLIVSSPYPTAGSWAPDNKTFYFVDVRKNGLGISAIDVESKKRTQLTPSVGTKPPQPESEAPAARVVQGATRSIPGGGEETVPAAGQKDQAGAQTPVQTVDLCPSASPDGKTVVFVRGTDIWAIGADGSNERLLAKSDAGKSDDVAFPCWSKDGSMIMFQLQRRMDNAYALELWTLNSDGTDVRRAFQAPTDNQFDVYGQDSTNPPQLTADGKSAILTLVGDSGLPELWLVDLGSGKPKQLTASGATLPSLSPDGKRLAYTSEEAGQERISVLDMATGVSTEVKVDR